MIPLIIGIIFFIFGFYALYRAQEMEVDKTNINNYKASEKRKINRFLQDEQERLRIVKEEVLLMYNRKESLKDEYLLQEKKCKDSFTSYQKLVQGFYQELKDDFLTNQNKLKQELSDTETELQKIKDSLAAGVQARLREEQMKDEQNFYKIVLSENDLNDIKNLNELKSHFSAPVVINKLIWTQYFQKKVTELCNRILGTQTICGIYKITNLETKQVYIGQSKDIDKRWKEHFKCGLGIDTPSTNKLYAAMLKYGVWNFSFELLEECPKELLNEKECQWIEMYQSNKYGYNITGGNK